MSLPPLGPDLRAWGENLTRYLQRTADRLRQKTARDVPAEDGIILWDAAENAPVVSFDGQFLRLVTTSEGTSAPRWLVGTGTPEGSVAAPVGSLFSRTDGGAGTVLYVKESGVGNTGWAAK